MDCKEKFSTKNKMRGRPPQKVIIPSVAQLVKRYGLTHKAAAPLQGDSLLSKAAYHAAALKELITRTAGQALRGRNFQAKVFNVSQVTIRVWSALAGVVARYVGRPLAYFNLKQLPELDHIWIEEESGKRYPSGRGIAARLLSMGKRLTWFNRYEGKRYYPNAAAYEMSQSVKEIAPEPRRSWPLPAIDPEPTPAPLSEPLTEKPIAIDPEPKRREYLSAFQFREYWAGHDGTEGIRLSGNYKARAASGSIAGKGHRISKEHESLCNRIQSKLPTMALKTIENLIQTYGPERVTEALNASVSRSRITNPSGYFRTILERQ